MLNLIKFIIMKWKKNKVMQYQDIVFGKFIESLDKPKIKENNIKRYKKTITYDMEKFPGRGFKLGDK